MPQPAQWTFRLTTAHIRLLGELATWAAHTLPGTSIYGPATADYVRQWADHVTDTDTDDDTTHTFVIDDHGYRYIHGWLTRYATDHGTTARDDRFGLITNLSQHHRPGHG